MKILKSILAGLALLTFTLGAVIFYLLPDHPIRGAVRDNWSPAGKAAPAGQPKLRESCSHREDNKQAFFGDLHVHTKLSWDASRYGTLASPADAYRFATGKVVALTPAPDGRARSLQIDRPLDFAAVTDHAEWLADATLCTDETSGVFATSFCQGFRQEGRLNDLKYFYEARFRQGGRSPELCSEDGYRCREATLSAWEEIQQAAEAFYDRSSHCTFTTFTGYEYSRRDGFYMMHRNVIFRNEMVPELPISWIETDKLEELWQGLARDCNDAPGHCEAIAIPHNMNLSSGMAFRLPHREGTIQDRRVYAKTRSRFEPLVEVMQAKGESECRSGLPNVVGTPDEYCNFEKMVPSDPDNAPDICDIGSEDVPFGRCLGPLAYARYGLAEGLSEEAAIGVNPLEYGFIGSTDTHNGTPGAVSETDYEGHTGSLSASPVLRVKPKGIGGKSVRANPGGLAGIWAEENSRDALFDAMQRRETFATSGPRIQPRFFAGREFPSDICQQSDNIALAYASGVPMGSELTAIDSPEFLLMANQDAEGNTLERLQIIKVWSEGEDQYGQAVHDIAAVEATGSVVDLGSCEILKQGAASLCSTWQDPDFDLNQSAAYYMRVIEMPSCRWSHRQCLALPESERPSNCSDPNVPKIIQERAWTSPIWVSAGPTP